MSKLHFLSKKSLQTVIAFCGLALSMSLLSSCDLARNTLKPDRSGNMEVQDYRDALAPRQLNADDVDQARSGANIPEFKPYVASNLEQTKPMPLVSISVNQTIPVRDVLFELAQQAEYDLELDPNIRGSIIYTARERPFDQVIERISDIAGLRYKFEDDVLRVELDEPYNKTYKIDYLNFVRSNESSISNNISVVSGEGADTGSRFGSSSESEADFWGELEANLTQILGNATNRSLRTSRDPRITAVEQNPEVAAVSPQQGDNGVQVQAPEAVLRVDSLPVDDMEESRNSRGNNAEEQRFSFAVNRQAGLISVFGNEKAQNEVREYLKLLKVATTSQVLIEAKIFEVSLSDEFASGIDWQALNTNNGGRGILQFDTVRPTTTLDALNNFVVGYVGPDFSALVEALQAFGSTKALASPRLTVLNNQSAVLNVATNVVYFEIDIDTTDGTDSNPPTTEIDTDIKNVPEGVLVNVQPSIDLENGTITMALRPTVTRIVQRVPDPGVAFVAQQSNITIESGIPELNVQEIDSVIQMRSGQPIVMGGLLQDRTDISEGAVPVLGELPIFGSAFRNHDDTITKTELVIMLKATIIDQNGQTIHATDKDLYRQFSGDRRPFKL